MEQGPGAEPREQHVGRTLHAQHPILCTLPAASKPFRPHLPEPAADLLPDPARTLSAAAQPQLLPALPGVPTCRVTRVWPQPVVGDTEARAPARADHQLQRRQVDVDVVSPPGVVAATVATTAADL